jgi:hypothetical protein
MIFIVNINAQKFSLNGIPYFKNFTPYVIGDKVKIINTYDSKFSLTEFEDFDQYSVNGVVYTSVLALQNALLPVLFTRSTLGGGGGGVTTLQELLTNGSTAGFNGIENPDAAFEVKMPFNTEDGLASTQTIVTPNSEVYLGIGIAHLVCNVALQYQISINHSKTIKIAKDIMIVADDNFDEGSYQNLEGISTFDTISGILTPSAYLIKAPIPKIGTVVNIRLPYKEESGDYDLATKDELDLKADLVGGKVPSSQLPATVDEILEGFYVNQFYFETTDFVEYIPESNKYYLDLNSNKTYRWSGTQYVSINEGIALGETSSTAYRGDRGKTAYDHSQASGNPHGTTAAQVGAYTTGQVDTIVGSKADKALMLEVVSTNIPLTATTASQKMFGSLGSNADGSFTLGVGVYFIQMNLSFVNAGASQLGFYTGIGDGTSAFSSVNILITSVKGGFTGQAGGTFTRMTSFSSNPVVTNTSSNTNAFSTLAGTFRVTSAGKFYPGISLSNATAAELVAGSYCLIIKVG